MRTNITISVDARLLVQLDQLVAKQVFSTRSKAIEELLRNNLIRKSHTRLARECAKLNSVDESALAEESFGRKVASHLAY